MEAMEAMKNGTRFDDGTCNKCGAYHGAGCPCDYEDE